MVIDTCAVLAILQDEPERRAFNTLVAAAEPRLLSAVSMVELSILLEARFGSDGQCDLHLFLSTAEIEIVAVDRAQAELARRAFSCYGKGRHRAGLNFGDCFSYALAKGCGVAMLFKGNDFRHTDLHPAWMPSAS